MTRRIGDWARICLKPDWWLWGYINQYRQTQLIAITTRFYVAGGEYTQAAVFVEVAFKNGFFTSLIAGNCHGRAAIRGDRNGKGLLTDSTRH